MDTDSGYYRRLCSRAWFETKAVWTSYRWWLAFAATIATVLLQITRHGLGSVVTVQYQDLLINAVGGATVAFLGSFIISLFRSPALLDAELRERNTLLAENLTSARALLAAPKVGALEEQRRTMVAQKLAPLSEGEKNVLRYLLYHRRTHAIRLAIEFGDEICRLAQAHGFNSGLIITEGHHCDVNDVFVPALTHYFSQNRPVTPADG